MDTTRKRAELAILFEEFRKHYDYEINFTDREVIFTLLANYIVFLGYRRSSIRDTESTDFNTSGESSIAECLHLGGNNRYEFTVNEEEYHELRKRLVRCINENDTLTELALYQRYFSKGMGAKDNMMMRINLSIANLLFELMINFSNSKHEKQPISNILKELYNYIQNNQGDLKLKISGQEFTVHELFSEFDTYVFTGLLMAIDRLIHMDRIDEEDYESILQQWVMICPQNFKGPLWEKYIGLLETKRSILPGYISIERISKTPWNMTCKEAEFFIINFQQQSRWDRPLIFDISNPIYLS
jgi:hypothetical protein